MFFYRNFPKICYEIIHHQINQNISSSKSRQGYISCISITQWKLHSSRPSIFDQIRIFIFLILIFFGFFLYQNTKVIFIIIFLSSSSKLDSCLPFYFCSFFISIFFYSQTYRNLCLCSILFLLTSNLRIENV